MNGSFADFLNLPRDVWEKSTDRLGTLPGYVEKTFGVSLVFETLFNRLPEGSSRLFFKGGSPYPRSLASYAVSLRMSIGRRPDTLGFAGEQDPTAAAPLSNKQRHALFGRLKEACSNYILGELRTTLTELFVRISDKRRVIPERADRDKQTLFIECPTLYPAFSLT